MCNTCRVYFWKNRWTRSAFYADRQVYGFYVIVWYIYQFVVIIWNNATVFKKKCIFAAAYEREVSSLQEKHGKIVPLTEFAKIHEEGRALMLSLVVYAIGSHAEAYPQAWDMFHRPRFLKGVWRYLVKDGHEHISLMPFLFAACWRLGAVT